MSVHVISTPIVGSSLARIAVEGGDAKWYAKRPANADEWKRRADESRAALIEPNWLDAISPALNAGGRAAERLERAAQSGVAVTTGQQPGLFGGPLYTWWKAYSALALAKELEKKIKRPVMPIFWAATDDSDFDEASYTVVPSSDGAERIEISGDSPSGTPLSEIPVGDVDDQLARLENSAGSAPNVSVIDAVRRAYRRDSTLGSAYVALLRELLEPVGIAVLDASHPSVRATAFPLLKKALERSEEIEDALGSRSKELKAAGHSQQVKLVKGRTLVFGDQSGRRDRIRMRDVSDTLSDAVPGSLGPNVLLRPIIERAIIPTVAYLGGGAEIAYFAQTAAVADALGVPKPLVVPRWSGMVIEPRIEKILDRYSLSPDDFRDPHAVESRIARESLPPELRKRISALEKAIADSADKLTQAEGADLVAPSVLEGMRRGVLHRVERLERRFAASVKRRGNEALRDAAIARGSLYPSGSPQERALNIIPLLARHGDDLVQSVLAEAGKHAERIS
ncbi:MAG TPA: bacillithiol biosynthesis cysteine-adding enzyme BshC [Gemmatimonadaceae bacterium]|nr:bacillithiol biosynthesis cysteine-adding enzyme BshC [Gemmatimonadaceae bacterium]